MPDLEPVYLLSPSGNIVEASRADAPNLLQQAGWSFASPAQIQTKQKDDKYGSTLGALRAFGESALSSATFGLGTAAETALGVDPEDIKGYREANPIASGLGTATGIIAPLLAGGPLGGGAAAAKTGAAGALQTAARLSAPSLVARAGQAVRAGAEGAMGVTGASSLGARVAAKAASGLLGGAVEGAFYGAGQVVDESVLGDPAEVAQSAVSTIGLSALMGGGLGGLFGAGEVLIPSGARQARVGLDKLLGKTKDLVIKDLAVPGSGGAYLTDNLVQAEQLNKALRDARIQPAPILEALGHGDEAPARLFLDNIGRIQPMEEKMPGIISRLAGARGETIEWAFNNMDDLVRAWEKSPRFVQRLLAQPPSVAQIFLNNAEDILGAKASITGDTKAFKLSPKAIANIRYDLWKNTQDVVTHVDRSFKDVYDNVMPKLWEQALKDVPLEQTEVIATRISQAFDHIEQTFKTAKADPFFPKAAAENISKVLSSFEDYYFAASNSDATGLFKSMLDLRRKFNGLQKYRTAAVPTTIDNHVRALASDVYKTLNGVLKDETVFGKAAATLGDIDKVKSNWEQMLKDTKPWLLSNRRSVSSTKIGNWVKNFDNDMSIEPGKAFSGFTQRASEALDTLENLNKAAPSKTFDAQAVESIINKAQEARQSALQQHNLAQLQQQFEQGKINVQQQLMDTQASMRGEVSSMQPQQPVPGMPIGPQPDLTNKFVNALAGQVAGSVIPGYNLAASLKTAWNYVRGAKTVEQKINVLSMLEKVKTNILDRISTGAQVLASGSTKANAITRAEASAGVGRIFAQPAATMKRIDMIGKLAGDPNALHAVMSAQQDAMGDHAPNITQNVNVLTGQAIQFLASKIPVPPQQGLFKQAPEISHAEMATFNRYWEAVNDPLSVLKQAASGTITQEAMEAVQAVHPQLLGTMRQAVLTALASARTKPTYQGVMGISMLLGIDPDGTLNPAMIQQAQQTYMKNSAKSPDSQAQLPVTSMAQQGPASLKGMEKLNTHVRMTTPFHAPGLNESMKAQE